jgi:hypothetical protein
VHKAVNPHCTFVNSLESPVDKKIISPPSSTVDAVTVSTSASATATPATKKKARGSSSATPKQPPQKKVKKMPSFSGSSTAPHPQHEMPLLPMAHALGMLPFFMHAQQFSAMYQSQAAQDLAMQQFLMQPFLFDPTKPFHFDPTQPFPALQPTEFSLLRAAMSPYGAPQLVAGQSANASGLNTSAL